MQLSSRILTALAVLILAVAVVAVRAGSTGTVEAATGTIDVLNVGTCYTTDTDVFVVGACDDGDGKYEVADRKTITEAGTVYATYAHDPKTAPDSPRGILMNSNLIKISIADSGRDQRTPVLLGAGDARPCEVDPAATPDPIVCAGGSEDYVIPDNIQTTEDDESLEGHLKIIQKDYDAVVADEHDFRWVERGGNADAAMTFDNTDPRIISGITISKEEVDASDLDGDGITPNEKPDYKPMFTVDGDGSPISLYGMFDADAGGPLTGEFKKLNTYLAIDEDVGDGRVDDEGEVGAQEVAPWFSVKASIDAGASVTVMYVVYETSERETLVGGQTTDASYDADVDAPKFTKAEVKSLTDAMVVEARSDGPDSSQNLRLLETSRFSGRYEGYLRLTDENGNDSSTDSAVGMDPNWGLMVGDATGPGDGSDEAAVIGVESGPVNIAYRDSDGANQLLTIAIDTIPPSVQIDTPAHNSEGQDTSPEFAGSFSDSESGLRKDTFRLYVDHKDDINENGEDGVYIALDLRVDSMDSDYGYVTPEGDKDVVESHGDYAGFSSASPEFGIIPQGDVFKTDPPGSSPSEPFRSIEGDNHDDGATNGTFGNSVRISFLSEDDYNNTIDFQGLVADVAGNIGFSDSDNEGPRFINHLGEQGKQEEDRPLQRLGLVREARFLPGRNRPEDL